jgi:transient receptor potential cation channel subfamily A protein 1
LLIAISFGSSFAVQELLSQGADFMTVDADGVNVLQHAVKYSNTLKVLVKCVEDIGDLKALISYGDKRKATALHYAAHYGNKSDVSLLSAKGASQAAGDQNGAIPLHLASGRGHLPIVGQLCATAPRTINAVDLSGRTPLHIACLYGKPKVAQHLIENGATLLQDRDGRSAFHCAAWCGSIECLKVLLASFPSDLNTVDAEKATALHLAVVADHPDVTEFLLDNGASVTDNEIGQNCLDVAINKCFEGCAYTIVRHERWKETMKPLDTKVRMNRQKSQLQRMVEKIPDAAMIVMDRCIETSGSDSDRKQTYDFSYILGLANGVAQIPALASVRLFEAMLKFKRKSCLAHPLCIEFLNCKWRKFGAVIVLANILIYLLFMILLMAMVVFLPPYSPNHLGHEENLARLVDAMKLADHDNRTYLSGHEKIFYCYGSPGIRLALLVAVCLCVLKEVLPMWYLGRRYFIRISNITELAVYAMAITFLDPLAIIVRDLDIPLDMCPWSMWCIAAVATFLGWIVLFLNFQRLPHIGIYFAMVISMVKTTLQFVIVASLFVMSFGLAFFMLLNNEPAFSTGGLSLIRTSLMTVGDLSYGNILPTFLSKGGNLSHYFQQLNTEYGHFLFVPHLPSLSHTARVYYSDPDRYHYNEVLFSSLAYVMFLIFCLLMPVVVLNTLIGLAVGNIEASRKNAAYRQIQMQVKLLIDLETALPPWFVSRIQMRYSQHSTGEGTMRHWLRHATQAANQPEPELKLSRETQLEEIRHNIHMLHGWLTDLDQNMQGHLSILKCLAECLKRKLPSRTIDFRDTEKETDKGDSGSERDLVKANWSEPSVSLSYEEDIV